MPVPASVPVSSNQLRPGILRRLASMFYEILLLLAVLALLLAFPHALIGAFTHHVATPLILQLHFFLVLLIYFLWFWCNGGQTLAMKTWHIRLATKENMPVKPAQALLRYLLCWPSVMLAGLGILWALVDRDGQFLHDRLAGTRLIIS
jgi:uncharacterized RDD family membrane protein YckC